MEKILFLFLLSVSLTSLSCNKKTYKITILPKEASDENKYVITDNPLKDIVRGENYELGIKPKPGYALDGGEETFKVTWDDGTDIFGYCEYKKDIEKLIIKGNVTTSNTIVYVSPVLGEYTFTLKVGKNYISPSSSFVPSVNFTSPEYSYTIEAKDGYSPITKDQLICTPSNIDITYEKIDDTNKYALVVKPTSFFTDVVISIPDAIEGEK